MSNALISNAESSPLRELKKSLKQADQQAKFLYLQAEIELLWQQVQRSQNSNDQN